MNTVRIIFLPENRVAHVPLGTTIADVARKAGIPITSPCGGTGTCGRCRVLLADVGSVLACQHRVTEDTIVEIPATSRPQGLAVHVASSCTDSSPSVVLDPLMASEPSNEKPATSTGRSYGIALDIGTSTVAAELVDMKTGQVCATAGRANSQASFGAEVTRRIEHVEAHGPDDLADAVIEDIHVLIDAMLRALGAKSIRLQTMVAAGNTAMLHFLYRYDPSSIRRAPHVPLVAAPPATRSSALGLDLPGDPSVFAVPCIGGWVGGDITAGILATRTHRDDARTLLIDIGTNGEIVLGNSEWMMASAASAGPAFEGCGITCGCGAIPGAIDSIRIRGDGSISWTTIGGRQPHGVCGSGLISIVASLFRAGLVDRAGRILAPDMHDGEPGILLVPAKESATGQAMGIAQRDIDGILLAKAAIFAGVQSLLAVADLSVSDLDRLIICGGFGSVLKPKDAVALGLVPDLPEDRITFAGNTALRGARTALLNRHAWHEAQSVAHNTTYIELIDQAGYLENFSSAQFIPHTDLGMFPSVEPPVLKTRRF